MEDRYQSRNTSLALPQYFQTSFSKSVHYFFNTGFRDDVETRRKEEKSSVPYFARKLVALACLPLVHNTLHCFFINKLKHEAVSFSIPRRPSCGSFGLTRAQAIAASTPQRRQRQPWNPWSRTNREVNKRIPLPKQDQHRPRRSCRTPSSGPG